MLPAAVIWLAAVSAIVWLCALRGEPPRQLLGDEYGNPKLKVSFRPPAGWKLAPMPAELAQKAIGGSPLLSVYFEGLRVGEFCTFVIAESDQSLEAIARQARLSRPPGTEKDVVEYDVNIAGLEGWGCEWTMSEQAVVHQTSVVLKRGGQRIFITYAAPESSYRRQKAAISASFRSLSFW